MNVFCSLSWCMDLSRASANLQTSSHAPEKFLMVLGIYLPLNDWKLARLLGLVYWGPSVGLGRVLGLELGPKQIST